MYMPIFVHVYVFVYVCVCLFIYHANIPNSLGNNVSVCDAFVLCMGGWGGVGRGGGRARTMRSG